uniref:Uncharacterized protein n=1 Tax=Arundo donax TaxID=35708 RepID=A0A0A9C7S0_ARUDO
MGLPIPMHENLALFPGGGLFAAAASRGLFAVASSRPLTR